MRIIISAVFIALFGITSYSTPQIPDLLIVGTDTFSLFSYPIDKLNFKANNNPFNDDIVSTNCLRGYQAIWELKNGNLLLQKIRSCHNDSNVRYSKVIHYFESNGYKPKITEGKILADWYTVNLVESKKYFFDGYITLVIVDKIKKKDKKVFVIEKGILKND